MPKKIYQIHVSLTETQPMVWRRLLVDADTLLVDLHRIIQTTLGWTNSHLHQFSDGTTEYAPKEFQTEGSKDSRKVKLNTILNKDSLKITYEYDFGDDWLHEIILEEVIETQEPGQIPKCLDGSRNCPPEDCGDPWGYQALLTTLANPKHPDYKSLKKWLGGKFDPEYFNKEEINQNLKKKDYGCVWL